MTVRTVTVAALPLALLALGATTAAQFHSRTDLFEVGAVVLDHDGEPVSDLVQSDFEVLEDGRPVPIATFAAINADRPTTVNDGRFVALLIEARSPTARKLARELINRMGERDVLAVVSMTGSSATTTDDRETALKQLDGLATAAPQRRPMSRSNIGAMPSAACADCGTGGVGSLWLGYDGLLDPSRSGAATGPPVQDSRSGYAINALAQMESLSNQLRKLPHRRKAIIYLGSASPLNLTDRNIKNGDAGRWRDAVRSASRADVSINIIGTEGLSGTSYAGARMLADETGGDAIVDANVFDHGLDRLWERTGRYYLIGYTPAPGKKKQHAVDVRVKRRDAEVHALRVRAD